jgi:hypothetical protein
MYRSLSQFVVSDSAVCESQTDSSVSSNDHLHPAHERAQDGRRTSSNASAERRRARGIRGSAYHLRCAYRFATINVSRIYEIYQSGGIAPCEGMVRSQWQG